MSQVDSACKIPQNWVHSELLMSSFTHNLSDYYSIVKDSNADLTVGNWNSKKDPQSGIVLVYLRAVLA